MFVKVSGFHQADGIDVPAYLDNTADSDSDFEPGPDFIKLALIRWLSPHPDAMLRDSELRPICLPPFDINHALWRFAKVHSRRNALNPRNITRQLDMFPGNNPIQKNEQAERLSHAWYDLVDVDTIKNYMNCTCIDNDSELILQTITIPF